MDGDVLAFETLTVLRTLEEFDVFISAGGPWVAGFDFPFGQSRTFLSNIGWPLDWESYVRHAAGMSRGEFRDQLETYKRDRAYGDREHPRGFEAGTGAASPQKLYGVPVALMFYEGATRLCAAGVDLPGLRTGDAGRVAVEAYPGVAARDLIGAKTSYKSDTRRKQTAALQAARRAILAALCGDGGKRRFGLAVVAPEWLVDDPTADSLDAMLCAVQAAWALRHVLSDGACLALVDGVEGWIADPFVLNRLARGPNASRKDVMGPRSDGLR